MVRFGGHAGEGMKRRLWGWRRDYGEVKMERSGSVAGHAW